MWAFIIRLLGGWIPGFKPFQDWLGKNLWGIGLCLFTVLLLIPLATNIWDKFFPPKPQTQIENVGTYYAAPKPYVCGAHFNLWRYEISTGLNQK